MSTQPEALRLAGVLESGYVFDRTVGKLINQAAAELRRLHEVNEGWKRDYDLLLAEHKRLKRKWVGLTLKNMPDDKFGRPEWLDGVNWAEAKLKEKNG